VAPPLSLPIVFISGSTDADLSAQNSDSSQPAVSTDVNLSTVIAGTFPVQNPDGIVIGAAIGGVLGFLLLIGIIAGVLIARRRRREQDVGTPSTIPAQALPPSRRNIYESAPIGLSSPPRYEQANWTLQT